MAEKRGVSVVVPSSSGGTDEINHENGTVITVTDGHLLVLSSTSKVNAVAIYAPNKWYRAQVQR